MRHKKHVPFSAFVLQRSFLTLRGLRAHWAQAAVP
jgi:hypothetical protein